MGNISLVVGRSFFRGEICKMSVRKMAGQCLRLMLCMDTDCRGGSPKSTAMTEATSIILMRFKGGVISL